MDLVNASPGPLPTAARSPCFIGRIPRPWGAYKMGLIPNHRCAMAHHWRKPPGGWMDALEPQSAARPSWLHGSSNFLGLWGAKAAGCTDSTSFFRPLVVQPCITATNTAPPRYTGTSDSAFLSVLSCMFRRKARPVICLDCWCLCRTGQSTCLNRLNHDTVVIDGHRGGNLLIGHPRIGNFSGKRRGFQISLEKKGNSTDLLRQNCTPNKDTASCFHSGNFISSVRGCA